MSRPLSQWAVKVFSYEKEVVPEEIWTDPDFDEEDRIAMMEEYPEISESAVNEASTVKYPDIDYHIVRTPVEGLAERLTASLKLPGQVLYILH